MKEKTKKLYFTNDFSPKNVKKLQGEGWILRNANLAKNDSFAEQADEYGGDVPNHYKIKDQNITVTISAETSPELQKTFDDAKAEYEKVQAENDDLKQQVKALEAGQVKGEPADLSGLVPVEQFDAVAQKLNVKLAISAFSFSF